jgi:hypothetical protein
MHWDELVRPREIKRSMHGDKHRNSLEMGQVYYTAPPEVRSGCIMLLWRGAKCKPSPVRIRDGTQGHKGAAGRFHHTSTPPTRQYAAYLQCAETGWRLEVGQLRASLPCRFEHFDMLLMHTASRRGDQQCSSENLQTAAHLEGRLRGRRRSPGAVGNALVHGVRGQLLTPAATGARLSLL